MRNFHSSVTDLRESFRETITSFPYETGWADEAIYFVTAEAATPDTARITLRVQLSADGLRWVDEGATVELTGPSSTFVRLSHFGGFLRLIGEVVDDVDPTCTLTIRLALKG
jgi:hypothetical protein